MQYKIPAGVEIPDLEVEFDSSYEPKRSVRREVGG